MMAATSGPDRKPARRTLDHVLGRVLTSALPTGVAREVIRDALKKAGLSHLPKEPGDFLIFVHGSLDSALEKHAGREIATAVIERLEPALRVARHRGRNSGIAPTSEPSMPAVRTPEAQRSGVRPRVSDEDEASAMPAPATAQTILIATAEPSLRETLRRELQKSGHRVVAAHDGHVALALCVRYEPALVLCDAEMPRVSGKEFVSSLELALGAERPRVILFTEGHEEQITGVFCQVTKPIHPDGLELIVDAGLSADG